MFLIHDIKNIIRENKYFFHTNIAKLLEIISRDNSIPHIIFYGQNGSGKRTIIKQFLEMLYDDTVHNEVDTSYMVSGSGNNELEVSIKQSNYHIIIEPNNNNFDKFLVQYIVKEYAKKKPLNVFKTNRLFKVIQINNMNNLPYYAQTALRRTMEKYSYICRFIMWTNSLSKVIEPIRSRCLCIRIPAPTYDDIFNLIFVVNLKKRLNLTVEDITNIINKSERNIKNVLWMLELHPYKLIFNESIDTIMNSIIYCITKNKIMNMRECLYKLTSSNIENTEIIIMILKKIFMLNLSFDKLYKIIEGASIYEYNIVRGRHEIIHLEAFCLLITKYIT